MSSYRINLVSVVIVLFGIMLFFSVGAVEPFGATVTPGTSERSPVDSAGTATAFAGNVTELTISGYSVTQSWQGYFGNVTGAITLEDGGGNALYNWSLASPQGEIFTTKNASVNWGDIMCFNFTATGTYADDSGQRGATSLFGTNLSLIESEYNIAFDDVDGVNETFTLIGAGTHDLFYTNNLQFSEGECRSTRVFGDTGEGVSDEFEEVLLYDYTTASVIFTALLEEDVLGFNTASHDFELLVLEDGHDDDVEAITYYFYVELE